MPQTHSTHEDIVQHPNVIPVDYAHKSVSETRTPPGRVATTANVPPGTTVANDPPGTAGNVAPAPTAPGVGTGTTVPPAATPAPTTFANVPAAGKPLPETWETNHKKHTPVSTLSNAPTVPKAGGKPAAPPAGGMANVPPGPSSTGPAVLPDLGGVPDAGPPVSTPANVAPAGSAVPAAGSTQPALAEGPNKGGRKGVRWDSHLPGKDVVTPPSRTATPK